MKNYFTEIRCGQCGLPLDGPRWNVCKCNWDNLSHTLDAMGNFDWISPLWSIATEGDIIEKILAAILFIFVIGFTYFFILPLADKVFCL